MTAKSEEWIPCTTPEVDDILRWTEPLFAPPTKARGKTQKMGDQRVTAHMMSKGEFYEFEVLEAIKISGSGNIRVKAGDKIRRKPASIAMGDCYKKRV
jgi:hypothetical protein